VEDLDLKPEHLLQRLLHLKLLLVLQLWEKR
jgi:hypothetical protein